MKKLLLDIYYVWVNELKVVFKDPAVILLFFIVPLAYPVLYSFIYNNETVHNVKAIVVDDSNSALSREFKRKVDATADVKIIGYATDMEEAKEAMRRKEAYGIYYIPSDFSQKINTGQQTQVDIFADMSSLLFYKALLLSATEVSLDMGANIRVSETGGESRKEDDIIMQPVENEWIPFYNIQNGFASFLIPAILILILQQTLILGISTIVGTHNDKKRFTIASHTAAGKNVGALKLTIGKAFCYSSLYMLIAVWVLRIIPYIFKLPQIGDPITIAVFLMPFLLAATFFSMTLSYFSSQREFAMLLFVFTSVIFVFISGISWPWTAIPAPLKAIAYIIPSTPGIHGFVKINTMGSTLIDVWPEYIALWIQAAIYCTTATFMYKWWIQNYDPEYKGLNRPISK
ncbi:ABC transporter permease [Dysgonomonas sp. ZJ279]|uniref:ABC transporter permease n=1 Tax=Dysgonomonas sp. ZJ279 TaxID=2709796 RepID=UPI0013EE10ED|nr:ABC transporter permease [Dysgonomonas sp. ZJ279]